MSNNRFRFRVWHGDAKEMLPIDLYWFEEQGYRVAPDEDDDQGIVLMQCTGLLDKHGNDIFEGDIVVQDGYPWFDEGTPSYRDTVEWIYSQWQAVAHCVNPAKRGISTGINVGLDDDGAEDGEWTAWEVVGNIHEHPELLEKSGDVNSA